MRNCILVLLMLTLILVGCGEAEPEEASEQDAGSNTQSQVETQQEVAENTPTEESQTMEQWTSPPEMQLEEGVDYQAVLSTSKGEITVDLLESDVPLTANNFVFLARQNFYDGVPFHRIVQDFMIQTGDPTGTGRGGPGYRFEDEAVVGDYTRGTVAMANAGPNTNGSQFFIMLKDYSGRLPKNYTIFGKVTEGMDVVDAIAATPVVAGPSGEVSKPTETVTIDNVEIVEK